MSDKKISQLDASTTPLAGTEVLAVVQSGDTKKVSVANLTAGRDVAVNGLDATSFLQTGSVAQNETHQYMLSNWNTANEFSARITADYFGKIRMSTAVIATGSDPSVASYTEQFELQSGNLTLPIGNLVIGTSGKGIDFSADGSAAGMTSELLDDYEEGTWTPAQGAGLTVVGDFSSSGTYTKIGRQVTVSGRLEGSTSVALGAGGILTNNLPFATGSSGTGNAVDSTAAKSSALIAYSGGSFIVFSASATTASPFVDFSLTYFV